MPFVLIIIGVVFLDAAVRNTVSDSASGPGLTTLLKGDFTGKDNFLYWMTAILIIGSVGYVDALKPISRMFMGLVLVVLFLSNGGFFTKAYSQLFGADAQNLPGAQSLSNLMTIPTGGQNGSGIGEASISNAEGESVPLSVLQSP
jgi:hypothetical protein